jgi:hypothetical protein
MLGLAPDTWGALGVVAGAVGTLVAAVYGRISASDKRAHDLELSKISDDVERLDKSVKAAWLILDDLRFNAVRKQDQDRLRDEFRADVKALGDRLEIAITALRNDIHRDQKGGS